MNYVLLIMALAQPDEWKWEIFFLFKILGRWSCEQIGAKLDSCTNFLYLALSVCISNSRKISIGVSIGVSPIPEKCSKHTNQEQHISSVTHTAWRIVSHLPALRGLRGRFQASSAIFHVSVSPFFNGWCLWMFRDAFLLLDHLTNPWFYFLFSFM